MPDIYLKRTLTGFAPLYDSDDEACKKIPIGSEVKAKISKPRNLGFHKKFWALMQLAFDNQEKFERMDDMREYLTMAAGYYRRIETPTGEYYRPQSISFASMDEIEFQDVFSKVLDQVIKLIGVTSEEIEQEIINFM